MILAFIFVMFMFFLFVMFFTKGKPRFSRLRSLECGPQDHTSARKCGTSAKTWLLWFTLALVECRDHLHPWKAALTLADVVTCRCVLPSLLRTLCQRLVLSINHFFELSQPNSTTCPSWLLRQPADLETNHFLVSNLCFRERSSREEEEEFLSESSLPSLIFVVWTVGFEFWGENLDLLWLLLLII